MRGDQDLLGKEVDDLSPEELKGRVVLRLRQCRQYERNRKVTEIVEGDLLQLARGAKKRLRKQ